ncbi:hypothetical protein FNAPI_3135 [Fusarium napiforme]|uniref:HNH nuclease domain-containing protein n=1 Tax=Fusarium napiforme TaxID=42672 RepID=A0A8H5K035_9HYPO|nr:hypothetical protein FNAPI_3135 [Fusarium napiforme]
MDQGMEGLVQAVRALLHDRLDVNISSDQFSSHLADILTEYREAPFTVPRELLLPEEFEQRREIGLRIQDRLLKEDPNFKVRMFHVAAIAVVPLQTLLHGKLCPNFHDGVAVNKTVDLIMEFERMRHFANLFVQKLGKPAERQYDEYRSTIHGDQRVSSSASESEQGQKRQKTSLEDPDQQKEITLSISKERVRRSEPQKRKCRERDGYACVITGMADPEVCHIFPFALNETVDNATKTKKFFGATEGLVSADFRRTYTPLMADARNLGGSDKVWNLICLNKTLHDWWGRAYWGFQYHGIDAVSEPGDGNKSKVREPDGVTLAGDNNSLDALNGEVHRFSQDESYYPTETPRKPGHVEFRLHTGETLKSGQEFHFIMDTEDAPGFKHMVDLQWASLRLFVMKGGAEADSFSVDDDSDNGADDKGQFGVKQKMLPLEQLPGETAEKGPDAPSPPRAHAAIETPTEPAELQSQLSLRLKAGPSLADLQIPPKDQAKERPGATLPPQQGVSSGLDDQSSSTRRSLRESLRGSVRGIRRSLRGARENLETRPAVRRLQDLFHSNRSSPQSPGKEQKEGKSVSATPSENVNPFQGGSVDIEERRGLVPLGALSERIDPNVRGQPDSARRNDRQS